MEESEALAVLKRTLPEFGRWIGHNRALWAVLQAHDWLQPPATDIEPTSAARGSTDIDPRLTGWLKRSREVLRGELTKSIEKIRRDSPANDPHPAMLPFGLLGPQSIASALHETAHTKLLAWFIDPAKPHGFGDRLLRTVLRLSALNELAEERMTLDNIQVRSERPTRHGRIDIFVSGTANNDPFSLWIEAKTRSDEGKRQLERYTKSIQNWKEKHGNLVAAIFLTPDGREAQSAKENTTITWQALAYPQLALALWVSARGELVLARDLLRLYLASLLSDVCGWPLPLNSSADYSVINSLWRIQ